MNTLVDLIKQLEDRAPNATEAWQLVDAMTSAPYWGDFSLSSLNSRDRS